MELLWVLNTFMMFNTSGKLFVDFSCLERKMWVFDGEFIPWVKMIGDWKVLI